MPNNPSSFHLPEEKSARTGYRYFDSQGRLVAWSAQSGEHLLFYQVKSFREITGPEGERTDVPAEISCIWTDRELDPNFEPAKGDTFNLADELMWDGKGHDFTADPALQYNCARSFDPTVGRWISEDPLGFELADENRFPYVQEPTE